MKDKNILKYLQRRLKKLIKIRSCLQRQIEKIERNNNENAIRQILLRICGNDHERCLLDKLIGGAVS